MTEMRRIPAYDDYEPILDDIFPEPEELQALVDQLRVDGEEVPESWLEALAIHHREAGTPNPNEAVVASVGELANPWHDERGRFAPKGSGSTGGGGGSKPSASKSGGQGEGGTGSEGDPDRAVIEDEDVDRITLAVADKVKAGEPVTIDDPAHLDEVVSHFADSDTPVDLTLVNVEGSHLYGEMRKGGIPRGDMPQIPKDLTETFQRELAAQGVTFTATDVDPASLKGTQSELDGRKVSQMMQAMQDGKFNVGDERLWVSNDGHILDGHHRWGASAAISAGNPGQKHTVAVLQVDLPIAELLNLANRFNDAQGVERKKFGAAALARRMTMQTEPAEDPAEDAEGAEGDGFVFYPMVTDEEDGITEEDLAPLSHGDGSAFPGFVPPSKRQPPEEEPPSKPTFGLVTVEEFNSIWYDDEAGRFAPNGVGEFKGGGNPYHDAKGRFAPKGGGSKSSGGGGGSKSSGTGKGKGGGGGGGKAPKARGVAPRRGSKPDGGGPRSVGGGGDDTKKPAAAAPPGRQPLKKTKGTVGLEQHGGKVGGKGHNKAVGEPVDFKNGVWYDAEGRVVGYATSEDGAITQNPEPRPDWDYEDGTWRDKNGKVIGYAAAEDDQISAVVSSPKSGGNVPDDWKYGEGKWRNGSGKTVGYSTAEDAPITTAPSPPPPKPRKKKASASMTVVMPRRGRPPPIGQFYNPWHDERGKFAPKGTGTKSGGSAADAGGEGPVDLDDEGSADRITLSPPKGRPGMGDLDVPTVEDITSHDLPEAPTPHSLLNKLDENGNLRPEVQAVYDVYIEQVLDGYKPMPPKEALYMGGGGGAGKTSSLEAGLFNEPEGSVTINADDIKTARLADGTPLIPEAWSGVEAENPAWAAIAHEESSYIAKRLQQAALERGLDIVIDATGANAEKVGREMQRMQDLGYDLTAAYITIPLEDGPKRVEHRYAQQQAARQAGDLTVTPRLVPPDVALLAHKNANNAFPKVAEVADRAVLVDNTTFDPKPVARVEGGEWTVQDRGLWDQYLERATVAGPIPEHLRQLSVGFGATMRVEGGDGMSDDRDPALDIPPRRINAIMYAVMTDVEPTLDSDAERELYESIKASYVPGTALTPVELDD